MSSNPNNIPFIIFKTSVSYISVYLENRGVRLFLFFFKIVTLFTQNITLFTQNIKIKIRFPRDIDKNQIP